MEPKQRCIELALRTAITPPAYRCRVGSRRVAVPGTRPKRLAIRHMHSHNSVLFGAGLEALVKVVEEYVDVRAA
jgi:hypothetical protein